MSSVAIDWRGRAVEIEFEWVGAAGTPVLVFLHEGLGSVAMWRDFPAALCAAAAMRGLVWSRPGYGRSTPRRSDEHWQPDFMHRQAFEVLPSLLDAVGVTAPYALFGHSDGGSIALLHAARCTGRVAAAAVVAPHIVVEPVSIASIAAARDAWDRGDLRARLAKYHADPDSAFRGWNDAWLSAGFRDWSIEGEIGAIRCPLFAVQGLDDEYGTLEQIRGIARRVPQTQLLELVHCGHSPHRDQPDRLILETSAFLRRAMAA